MTTKKFWCHYIGNDGNTPKRRNIELKNLGDLIPAIGDNVNCATPLWYDEYDDKYIETYAQLSDTVAVSTLIMGIIRNDDIRLMQMTDDDIMAEAQRRLKEHLEYHAEYTTEQVERERKFFTTEWVENAKGSRDRAIAKVVHFKDYTGMLLDGSWVSGATLRAYEEANSGVWPVLEHLRKQNLAEREEERKRREEEACKRREEEARKKAEAEAREQERLTQEAERFKAGESISGEDVVELCRRYGIAIHLRTVHNMQKVIANINGKDGTCQYYRQRGKRSPQLDGCYVAASKLYKYLQEPKREKITF